MGDIIQYNIRGLKSVESRGKKVGRILKILAEHETKFVSLQETRLTDITQIPKEFVHLKHIYHIVFCGATELDLGGGILIFVKKTEDILKESILVDGRLVYIQTKNLVTETITNWFSIYGKSN